MVLASGTRQTLRNRGTARQSPGATRRFMRPPPITYVGGPSLPFFECVRETTILESGMEPSYVLPPGHSDWVRSAVRVRTSERGDETSNSQVVSDRVTLDH